MPLYFRDMNDHLNRLDNNDYTDYVNDMVDDDDSNMRCRVCLSTGDSQNLIEPCECKGSIAHIHIACHKEVLKQARYLYTCSICRTDYKPEYRYKIKGKDDRLLLILSISIVIALLSYCIYDEYTLRTERNNLINAENSGSIEACLELISVYSYNIHMNNNAYCDGYSNNDRDNIKINNYNNVIHWYNVAHALGYTKALLDMALVFKQQMNSLCGEVKAYELFITAIQANIPNAKELLESQKWCYLDAITSFKLNEREIVYVPVDRTLIDNRS